MKIVSAQQMRELDRLTIQEFGIPGEVLMDRAGMGVADVVQNLARMAGLADLPVLLVAGRGNNGGDVFAAARYLRRDGFNTMVWLAGGADAVTGDALTHLSRMRADGIRLEEVTDRDEWQDMFEVLSGDAGIVVDGVLGTGARGPARGPAAGAIRCINELGKIAAVVAVDVPSGLDSDTGCAEGDVVCADITVTMGLPKRGLVQPCALDCVGNIEVVDIGIPRELTDHVESEIDLIAPPDLGWLAGRRPRASHKGTYGHVLILAGAAGYAGAAGMAAQAACRSGVGLVTVLAPEGIASTVAGMSPESMVHGGLETNTGSLSAGCLDTWGRRLDEFDAVLVGPGMTTHEDTRRLVGRVLEAATGPVVIDADGLNVLAGQSDVLKSARIPVVLTPHPGEMAKLLGCTTSDVQTDRFAAAERLASESGAIAVLKGAGTIVSTQGRPLRINRTGNPGMAKAGMGDVLSGFLAGLVAQARDPLDCACAAVYIHGRAGDNAAWHISQAGMTAQDVIAELGRVYAEISIR